MDLEGQRANLVSQSHQRLAEQHAQMRLQEFEGGLICVFQERIEDQRHAH